MILMHFVTVSESRPFKKEDLHCPPSPEGLCLAPWRSVCICAREKIVWKGWRCDTSATKTFWITEFTITEYQIIYFNLMLKRTVKKLHCGVKFQPYFQEQSSILSQIYLRDIFCLSWRDLILWKASPQVMCGINMVLWSHSWNREKIHFWTLSKMNGKTHVKFKMAVSSSILYPLHDLTRLWHCLTLQISHSD